MFKKIAYFAILGLFIAAFAVAQTGGTTQPQQPGAYPEQQPGATSEQSEMAKSSKITGTIDTVDLAGKSFTVKIDKTGESRSFTFDDKTKWDAKDKMFKADNLKAGDQVTIEADATNLATKIKVKEGTAAPKTENQ